MGNNLTDLHEIEDWEVMQDLINVSLEKILLKIEWHFGEGRAPFVFPPKYEMIRHKDGAVEYVCEIKLESDEDEYLRYTASDILTIYNNVKNDIKEKYSVR